MDIEKLKLMVASLPEARAISIDQPYWNDVVDAALDFVLDELLTAHDWDFATKEYESVVSVADQHDYSIRGDDNDCRDVVAIWYDDADKKLIKYWQDDMDDILAASQNPGGVFGWTQAETDDDGYPVVSLYNAPAASGTKIRARYLKTEVILKDFPAGFLYVIALGILSWVFPGRRRSFERAMKKIVRKYRRGGKDLHQTPINPRAVRANNEIAGLNGSG